MSVRQTLLLLVISLVAVPLIVSGIRAAQVNDTPAQQATPATQSAQFVRQQATPAATQAAGISALGSVEAETVVPLYFQGQGTVKDVYAQPGDFVQAGDVLADLDATDAWNTYNQAQLNLESAQIALDALKQPPSADDLKVAQANLVSAQAGYSSTDADASQVQSAQEKYDQAQANLAALQQARQNMNGSPDQISLQDAKIGAASFNTEIARLQLVQVQTPNSASQWQASLRIQQAQLNLEKLQQGPTQAQLDSAQMAVDRASAQLDDAQTAIERMQLVAPRDGYVTAVNVASGDPAASAAGAALELSDLAHLRITVPVNELDIDKIGAGAKAVVHLDALTGVDIPGTVERVGWLSTTNTDGIVTYDVQIALTTTDPRVRIGMTGEVEIETGNSAL